MAKLSPSSRGAIWGRPLASLGTNQGPGKYFLSGIQKNWEPICLTKYGTLKEVKKRQNSVYCKSIVFIPHTLCVWGYYRYNRIGWLGLLASLLESSAIWSIYKENMGCSFFCSVFNNHNSDVRPIGDDILNDEMLPAEWTWNQRM